MLFFIIKFIDGATTNATPAEYAQPNRSNKQKSPDIPTAVVKAKTPETPTPNNNANFSNIQNQLKKQLALDSRSRGPPPPAPIRTVSYILCLHKKIKNTATSREITNSL